VDQLCVHGVPGFGWDVSSSVLSSVGLGRDLTMRAGDWRMRVVS